MEALRALWPCIHRTTELRQRDSFLSFLLSSSSQPGRFSGRVADQKGRKLVLFPCIGLMAAGMGLLTISAQLPILIASATLFGVGFGPAYPVFAAYALDRVDARRRGAAFGSILLAMNTGIGFGSIVFGLVIERSGYRPALVLGSLLALVSIPYFRFAEKRLGWPNESLLKSSLESQPQSRLQPAYRPEDLPHRHDDLADDCQSIPPRLR
jgi:MFS family permease